MLITISPELVVEVHDIDDLRSLSIVGVEPPHDAASALAAQGVHLDDDFAHGFIEQGVITDLAPDTDEWRARFAEMLGYAARQGWTDEFGRIRAHTEWASTTEA